MGASVQGNPGAERGKLGEVVSELWNMRLFSSGETEVYLNQLVVALVVVVVGLAAARVFAGLVGGRLRSMGRIDRNTAHLLQKLLFYLLTVVLVLVALPIAGIPITIFTVLGGALAIGVGFGAQNLFNNLISGFIIMIEKPIRIGDIVEVEGSNGRIEDIGNRCVRVRRTDGVDVLMPNSAFLENPVINWTLFDYEVRGKVTVGVAYGSPCRDVERLILQAAREHAGVRDEPPPLVLFEEFGDNALTFTVLFWAHVERPMDMRRIQSDLRYRIDELFREAGITIAFPQRDVHLDTLSPLEVRLTPSNERGSGRAG